MTQTTGSSTAPGGMAATVRRVGIGGMVAGLVGGAAMIGLMIVVMGAQGSGYATPLNLGIPAFAKTITPPVAMLPMMMGLMGVHLPASAMAKIGPAFASGHLSAATMKMLSGTLMSMHIPAAKLSMMSALMTGHATNSMMANLLAGMPPPRAAP